MWSAFGLAAYFWVANQPDGPLEAFEEASHGLADLSRARSDRVE